MKTLCTLLFFLLAGTVCTAQQFSYQAKNPAFGGDTFNYNWLLSSATAQNQIQASRNARDEDSDLEQFGDALNRQILSQLSRTLLQQQIEGIGDLTQPGSFTFGTLNVEVFQGDEGLIINIFDTLTGEQTQVVVPN